MSGMIIGGQTATSDKLYVGGFFSSYKGVTNNGIIALNNSGTKDTTFDNTTGFAGGGVFTYVIDANGKIYVGGNFTSYKGVTANRIIRLNPDGTKDTGFDNSTGFDVISFDGSRALAIDSDGKIYVGGSFTSYKGVTANGIIRLNPDGTKDTGFDNSTGFDGTVLAFAIDSSGKIYVGGFFTTYKGVTANGIIRLNPDGTKDTGFDNSTGFTLINGIFDIALDANGKLYVVGSFSEYKGVAASNIIRLNPDGTKDTGFDNSTGFTEFSNVNTLTIDSSGKIYVGGQFSSYKGVTNNRIIRLNPDGTKDTGFDNATAFDEEDVEVYDIQIDSNGKIYVGGNFTSYKGVTANYIIRLNPDGSKDTTFDNSTGFNSDVNTFALLSGTAASPQSTIIISPTGTNGIIGGSPDEPLTGVWVGFEPEGSSGIADYTTSATNTLENDVLGPNAFTVFTPPNSYSDYGNFLYLGFTNPFNAVKLKVGIPSVSSVTLAWEYSVNGGYNTLQNLQETQVGLKQLLTTTEGIVYWDMPNDWQQTELRLGAYSEPTVYWVRIRPVSEVPIVSNYNDGVIPYITRILKTSPP